MFGCKLLDGETFRCTDYKHRTDKVSDCVRLTPRNTAASSGCRRPAPSPPAQARDLYSGTRSLARPGAAPGRVSVRGRVGASEEAVRDKELEDRIVGWPLRLPKAARSKTRP